MRHKAREGLRLETNKYSLQILLFNQILLKSSGNRAIDVTHCQ